MSMFLDRRAAGRLLARKLRARASWLDVLVLALPRGGVPVAFEVAEALDVPLDVFLLRKLGMPGNEEFALGAVASGGLRVFNRLLIEAYAIPRRVVADIEARERAELERWERAYRLGQPPLDVRHRNVILVGDGLTTGASMHAAVLALRQAGPARIIVAVPVASMEACEAMQVDADDVICLATPEPFVAVGRWYADFDRTTDAEVKELLASARERNFRARELTGTERR
jgi:predicted phosphoribosyltransferase